MAAVGRKRKADTDLPKYWKRSHGAIYLIVPRRLASVGKPGAWIRLGETEEEAHRSYADLLAGESAGKMQQLFDRYEKEVLPKKAKSTQVEQGRQLRELGAWCGNAVLGSLKRSMVQRYVDSCAPVSGNRKLSLLSHVCKKGMRWGLLEDSPCTGVERNKEDPQQELIDPVSQMMAWRIALPWMRALMVLAYVAGARRGDVRKFRDKDFKTGMLALTQNKTKGMLLLRQTLGLRYAREYAVKVRPVTPIEGWLVCNQWGRPISDSVFRREWMRVRAELKKQGGAPFMFKSLRSQSASDHETGEHLGHEDQRVLKKHYRLKPKVVTPL